MKNAIEFVSVDESALETVSGGLLDIGNYSLNGNTINILSGLSVNLDVGDVASNILNALNHVHGCGGCGCSCSAPTPVC